MLISPGKPHESPALWVTCAMIWSTSAIQLSADCQLLFQKHRQHTLFKTNRQTNYVRRHGCIFQHDQLFISFCQCYSYTILLDSFRNISAVGFNLRSLWNGSTWPVFFICSSLPRKENLWCGYQAPKFCQCFSCSWEVIVEYYVLIRESQYHW